MGKFGEMIQINSVSSPGASGCFQAHTVLQCVNKDNMRKHECTVITRHNTKVLYMCEYLYGQSSFLFSLMPNDVYVVCIPCHPCICREVPVAIVPAQK